MKQVAFGAVKREVLKNQIFKDFKKEFIKTLNAFSEYPRAIDISVSGSLSIYLDVIEYEDEKTFELHIPYSSRTIAHKHSHNSTELADLIMHNLIIDIADAINRYYAEELYGCWIRFRGIRINVPSEYSAPRIERFIAWDYNTVGIWYVEQECGQHWITLPTSWDVELPATLHLNIDKTFDKI